MKVSAQAATATERFSARFSRRDILKAAGIGATSLTLGGLGACTGAAPVRQQTAAAGGQISAILANPYLDLDPTTATSIATVSLNDFIYEALYSRDKFPPRTAISPDLATEMPRAITPTTYRIKLREGVTFHDGTPLTADDVVFTFQRTKAPETKSFFAQFFDFVKEVRAIGPTEVEFLLSSPTTLLTSRLVMIRILSRKSVAASPDALKLKPVGTGPYRLTSAVSGQQISMNRFTGYTGKRQITYDQLDFNCVTDANARISSLRTGQSRVIEEVPYSSFENLGDSRGVQAEAVPGDARTLLVFNCKKAPFNDFRARQAVLYAIDRDTITKSVFFGQAEPVWAGAIRPDDPDYVRPELTYRYDPEEAKRLLAAAGGAGNLPPIEFRVVSDVDYLIGQAPIIEGNLRAVGLTPNIVPGSNTAVTSLMAQGAYDLALVKFDISVIDPTAEVHIRYLYSGPLATQFASWTGDPANQVKSLLTAATTTVDENARRSALAEAQNIVQREAPVASLHRRSQITGWSENLQGFRPLPGGGLTFDGVTG